MTYKNVFTSGGTEARSAKKAADYLYDFIPGARPEEEGVDPELYQGIVRTPNDPRTVSDRSTVALNIVQDLISPMYNNFDATTASERDVTEDPASTSKMASSTVNDVATNTTTSIPPENVVIPEDQNPQTVGGVNHPPVSDNPQDENSSTRPPFVPAPNPQDPNSPFAPGAPATPTTTAPGYQETERP